MKTKKNLIIVLAALLIVLAVGGIMIYKAFNPSYYSTITKTTLSTDQQQIEKTKIQGYEQQIKEQESKDEKPDFELYVQKAQSEESLGLIGEAIKTFERGLFKHYEVSTVGFHNLGKLLEQAGEYEKANFYYKKSIENFDQVNLFREIAWNNYRLKEYQKAKNALSLYKQETGKTDPELEGLLEKVEKK